MAYETTKDKKELAEQLLGKSGDFEAYFSHYQDLVYQRNAFLIPIDKDSSQRRITYKDVLLVVDIIRDHAEWTLQEFQQGLKTRFPHERNHPDFSKLLAITVHAMFMVDCSAQERHASDFALGAYRPSSWLPDQKFSAFMERCLPESLESDTVRHDTALRNKNAIRAWKLKKKLGTTFRQTNDIAQHLVYDPRNNVLYIFHHAAFLKAQLSKWSGDIPKQNGMSQSLAR